MKNRIIKKHISRFIKPLIKDLPIINCRNPETDKNFSFINGVHKHEGETRCRESYCYWKIAINKTVQAIQNIKDNNKGSKIYLRTLQPRNKAIYMRLIISS